MRALRLRAGQVPLVGYCFRFAVLDGEAVWDLALTRRAALRRRPAVPSFWSTVIPIRKADA